MAGDLGCAARRRRGRGRRAHARAGGEPDVWLCFAPVKRARIDYIAEKATELGVAVLQPVLTQHTASSA
jgi:16S rRNA U1498 N3-methylase RsmE